MNYTITIRILLTASLLLGSNSLYAIDSDADGVDDSIDLWPQDRRYAIDSDTDGIADEWEQFHYGNLTTTTATSDSDSDGFTDLGEFNNRVDDPTISEPIRIEAQRRVPPMIESFAMPEQMLAGQTYTIDWKVMGYDSSYATYMVLFDCTGITDGSCGSSYGEPGRLHTATVAAPHTTEPAPWTYSGEVADYFHYQTSYTIPATRADGSAWATAGTPIVVRFYQKSANDAAAGKSSISLLIPGGISDTYYDTTGRRVQKRICPAVGCS